MVEKERALGVPPLRQLYAYVTSRCNCACRHCWIIPDSPSERDPHCLALDVFEAAVTEARPLGLVGVKWTGGEPTVHPKFPRLLEVQKRYGLIGKLETNGMAMTPALARLLHDSGVRHVSVSIDGAVPETHDCIRGVAGAFHRTLGGFRSLVAAGFNPQIVMSLMRSNVSEVGRLLELAGEVGAGSVKLNLVQPTLRGLEIHKRGEALSVDEVLEVRKKLDRPSHGFPIYLDVPMAFRSIGGIISGNDRSSCGIKTIVGLLADGSYALCGIGEHVPGMVFGKVGTEKLRDIWERHPVLVQIREGVPNGLKGICSRCMMKSICLGSCVAQNYYRTRDALAAFWFCERAAEEGRFPGNRLIPEGTFSGFNRI